MQRCRVVSLSKRGNSCRWVSIYNYSPKSSQTSTVVFVGAGVKTPDAVVVSPNDGGAVSPISEIHVTKKKHLTNENKHVTKKKHLTNENKHVNKENTREQVLKTRGIRKKRMTKEKTRVAR